VTIVFRSVFKMSVVNSFNDPTIQENDINITSVTSISDRRMLLNQFTISSSLRSSSSSMTVQATTGVIVNYIVTFIVNSLSSSDVSIKYTVLKSNLETAIASNNFTASLRKNANILGKSM
jgi:hypothetical protein